MAGRANENGNDPREITYPFSREYQLKILAILLRNRQFLPVYSDLVKAGQFGSPLSQETADLILDFFRRYRTVPGREVFEQLLDDEIRFRGTRLSKDVAEKWRELGNLLWEMDLSDQGAIIEQVVTWTRDQAFYDGVMQVAALFDRAKKTGKRDYGLAREIINQALQVGVDRVTNRVDYFGEIDSRISQLIMDDGGAFTRVPTLLPTVDRMLNSGPDRGELCVWAAPPSRGKTTSLVWVTKAALYQQYHVAFFTAELSKDKIAQRVDRSVTRMSKEEILQDPDRAQLRLHQAAAYRGKLQIIDIGGRSATVEYVHSQLEGIREREGSTPDVILVDYPGVMRGSTNYIDRRLELGEIYRDLRTLAKEWGAVVHTACQTNRQSVSKKVVTIQDLAECFEIAGISDIILALCQTVDEEAKKLLRIFIAKNRDGRDHSASTYIFDKGTGQFTKADDESAPLTQAPHA